jgi:predicted dienelactone hydrolase
MVKTSPPASRPSWETTVPQPLTCGHNQLADNSPRGDIPARGRPWLSRSAIRRWGKAALLGGVFALLTNFSASAAEKLSFRYGLLQRSIEVSSLRSFAETGTAGEDLDYYFRLIGTTEEEKETFRQALQTPAEVDSILVSRFLYSGFGEEILAGLGDIVKTPAGLNSQFSLRSALILAAQQPEGLTLLNFFEELPTNLTIDLARVREVQQAVSRIVEGTLSTIDQMKQLSAQEAANNPALDYSQLPNLTQPGRYGVEQYRLSLNDASRNRQFEVVVYRPQTLPPGDIPVVVYSHGLSDKPESARVVARHLASYGYVVAAPQHPGSDSIQFEAFESGLSDRIYLISDFVDRPQDISYLLDQLEDLNQQQFEGRLDLDNVGLSGHSFGGYTALALAGAKIDFDYLAEQCNRRLRYLNVSLLLQCDALQLPREDYDFRDPRITSVLVKNPVNSSVFGPKGIDNIDLPVLVAAGSHDPATPAVFEQFITFPWFSTPAKYLVLMEGQAHIDISDLDAGASQALSSIQGLNLAPSDQLDQYTKALSLAFFNTYTARKPEYQIYLRPSYAAYLSEDNEFKIYMISEISEDELLAPLNGNPLLPDGPPITTP